jgi:hypothetical protein
VFKGDINLLKQGELLISSSEGYTIIRKRTANNSIKTYVVIPLEEFSISKDDNKK